MAGHYSELRLTLADRRRWTIPTILEHQAQTSPDRHFLQFEDEPPLTFGEVDELTNRLANGFLQSGLAKGDRVAVLLPNCADYVPIWLAFNKVGAVPALLNADHKDAFLANSLRAAHASSLIVDSTLLPALNSIRTALGGLDRIYVRGGSPLARNDLGIELRDFAELWSDDSRRPSVSVTYRDLSTVLLTGGTTGLSKGVLMPQAHVYFLSEENASTVRLEADDVALTAFPLSHSGALICTVGACLVRGAKAVIYERFSASNWIDRVREHAVTTTLLVGSTAAWVCSQPRRPDDRDNQVRALYASSLPLRYRDEFRDRFGISKIVESYGQTEIGLVCIAPYDEPRPLGASGKIVAEWYDVRIADPDTDEDVPTGATGELLVRPRAPWISSLGYSGAPEATVAAMRNLWWHTGDAVSCDAEGWYFFQDRTNDALRVHGENISSFELEQSILTHPDIAMCAVVSIPSPDALAGEHEIKAYVVPKDARTCVPEELVAFFDRVLPAFAVPRFIEIVGALPLNENGKIEKRRLREVGVTQTTWDRVAAGFVLERERRRAARTKR